MLDTVILTIPYPNFLITKPDNFSPPARNLQKMTSFYLKFNNNPTAQDKQLGIYKPRLTIYKRGRNVYLKIEFSAPKLLYQNNLQELNENQFNEVAGILHNKLFDMGIGTSQDTIKQAEVSSFHPSKNILITGGYLATGVIKEFVKINLTEKLDLEKTQFRNGGHGLQFYSKIHSLVFYDKIADLVKSENRSFGKDQKMQQLSLFEFRQQEKKPEILRMEVRLSNKTKMKGVLKRLNLTSDPVFSDIFKKEVCQKILQNYFDTYIEPSLFVFDLASNPQAILKRILRGEKKVKTKEAIYLLGLWELAKDEGVRPLRRIIQPTKQKTRSWQRVSADLKYLNTLSTITSSQTFIKDIKANLSNFEPYKLPAEATKSINPNLGYMTL